MTFAMWPNPLFFYSSQAIFLTLLLTCWAHFHLSNLAHWAFLSWKILAFLQKPSDMIPAVQDLAPLGFFMELQALATSCLVDSSSFEFLWYLIISTTKYSPGLFNIDSWELPISQSFLIHHKFLTKPKGTKGKNNSYYLCIP